LSRTYRCTIELGTARLSVQVRRLSAIPVALTPHLNEKTGTEPVA
jgi:hypothetical protein